MVVFLHPRRAGSRPPGSRPSGGGIALALAVAGIPACAPVPKPVPAPVAPPPATIAPVPEIDWRDLPTSPGRWVYLPSATNPVAQFARPGVAPDLTIGCDRKARAIVLFRAGRSAGPITITTSYSGLTFPAQTGADGVSTTLPATSDFLDRIAFSRGHVTVAVPGLPLLVLPAWAEPARVIEDCRN